VGAGVSRKRGERMMHLLLVSLRCCHISFVISSSSHYWDLMAIPKRPFKQAFLVERGGGGMGLSSPPPTPLCPPQVRMGPPEQGL